MIIYAAIYQNNLIHLGRRHHEIINNAKGELKGGIQGFYTSDSRFVTREEAAIIAYNNNQITEPKKLLFSEDLW